MKLFPTIADNASITADTNLATLEDGLIDSKYTSGKTLPIEKDFSTVEANLGDGYIAREKRGIQSSRETYNLTWNNRLKPVIDQIYNFLSSVGNSETFVWQNPETRKYIRVKMNGNIGKNTQAGGDDIIGTLTATFIQVYEV